MAGVEGRDATEDNGPLDRGSRSQSVPPDSTADVRPIHEEAEGGIAVHPAPIDFPARDRPPTWGSHGDYSVNGSGIVLGQTHRQVSRLSRG